MFLFRHVLPRSRSTAIIRCRHYYSQMKRFSISLYLRFISTPPVVEEIKALILLMEVGKYFINYLFKIQMRRICTFFLPYIPYQSVSQSVMYSNTMLFPGITDKSTNQPSSSSSAYSSCTVKSKHPPHRSTTKPRHENILLPGE